MDEQGKRQDANETEKRKFRVVSPSSNYIVVSTSKSENSSNQDSSLEESNEAADCPVEHSSADSGESEVDDGFFAKSFALGTDRKESDENADVFAGGLRALFETEDERNDEEANEDVSESERFQEELEVERRESLDGVIMQNDSDFLYEAGAKYERGSSSVSSSDLFPLNLDEGVERNASIRVESVLEAMLFVGDRENNPLTLDRARELLRDVSEMEALEALNDLNERYFQNGAPYKIAHIGNGYRLTLRPEFADVGAKFGGKTREFKLSQTAIDVLSLIAYRQPISTDEILEVRSGAGSALSQLIKRDLIAREYRAVDNKKVVYYKTTERFLKLFNLESLDDLPIVGDIDYR